MRKGGVLAILVFALGMQTLGAKNLIKNGEFDDGLKYWGSGWIDTGGGAKVTFAVNSEGLLSGQNCWEITVENGGPNVWSIQRVQSLPLKAGVTYTLSFMGMALASSYPVNIVVTFEISGEPYTKYLWQTVALTDAPTVYEYVYTAEVDVPNNQLKFFFGANNNVTIYIDAIVVDDGEEETAVASAPIPVGFSLAQNVPNPFNPSTVIRYTLPRSSSVRLSVYDLTGREVASLVEGWKTAGTHAVFFEGHDLPSGTYLYRLETADGVFTRRMVLMK